MPGLSDSEFRQGDLTAYLTAAQEMLPILQSSLPSHHFAKHDPSLKPLLLVMSDSPHVAAEMKSGNIMHHDFEVSPRHLRLGMSVRGRVPDRFVPFVTSTGRSTT